ncbi:AI-2E family transporter [Enterococcus sp. CWB-B31]|uniref:AI-2E family transporter n=1 Tax=Enterococcus sp. CWB-B31 TaxID=2885159 RepID=UPI001E3E7431|nr:AI-2E family transporter [Enterococcus sp. CWB-B31]MCB5955234.1 AI-2E family transporter [Enterococcus sp. CWB-B31]
MNNLSIDKMIKKYLIIGTIIVLGLLNFQTILKWGQNLLGAFSNIIFAILLAYVINLIMSRIEKLFEKVREKKIYRFKRALSLLASLILLVIIIATFFGLVFPTIFESINMLLASLPKTFNQIQEFLTAIFKNNPEIEKNLKLLELDWKSFLQNIFSFVGGGVANTVDILINLISTLIGSLFNFLLIFVFAIYLLVDKERFIHLYKRLSKLYFPKKIQQRTNLVLLIIHQTFSAFITGQCLEAVILGTLCATGMFLFNMPYPVLVGTLVGVINIIPIVGAYVGGAIGMFLVFTVNPVLSLWFLVYLVILQQFESNFIYPRVVGNSVGLPGIYVLGSVIVFGPLAGIPGMFLGIPFTASIYKLGKIYIQREETQKKQEKVSELNL